MRTASPGLAALPEGIRRVESAAFMNSKLRFVYVPDGATSVDSRAFMNCHDLEAVRVPAGARVASDAFFGCGSFVLVTEAEDGDVELEWFEEGIMD